MFLLLDFLVQLAFHAVVAAHGIYSMLHGKLCLLFDVLRLLSAYHVVRKEKKRKNRRENGR